MADPGEIMRRAIDRANDCIAAYGELGKAASRATRAVSDLARAAAEGDAADIAAHPDLAYLDLQTRGFYD